MAAIPVIVQHSGQKYDLELDPSANGETFKYQVFSVTGVEPDRQKIIVKGGQLKDDQDMAGLGIKAKHVFRVLGTPSGNTVALEKPKDPVKFLEDLTEAEAAQSEGASPAGLQNLGNTCYLNSTLQTLRSIPELQDELLSYNASSQTAGALGGLGNLSQLGLGGLGSSTDLTESLRDLYTQMSRTQEGVPPLMFLNAFRSAYPQFAERSRDGRGYLQQDAEEAWSEIISILRQKLRGNARLISQDGESPGNHSSKLPFIDDIMGVRFQVTEECLDPAAKEKGEKEEKKPDEIFNKLNCYISDHEVRHLSEGIKAALTSTYPKKSHTLDRDADYIKRFQIARLPKYLPVHLVRFYWKKDINKKAKVLKRVTFQPEMDLSEYCTDELRDQLIPVRDKMRELRKEELDVERARKRQKRTNDAIANTNFKETRTKEVSSASSAISEQKSSTTSEAKVARGVESDMSDTEEFKTDAQVESERAEQILRAKRDLLAAVSPELAKDETANQTGLYELRGVITHQGASADSGHYTAYVKKEGKRDSKTGKREPEDGSWWWFNDDKVTEVSGEKIETLAGGGEAHSALILLYRAVELPVLDSPLEEID